MNATNLRTALLMMVATIISANVSMVIMGMAYANAGQQVHFGPALASDFGNL